MTSQGIRVRKTRGRPVTREAMASQSGAGELRHKNSFTVFVDRIFTTSFERLFTKLFDVTAANSANTCLYRASNAH
jgi:hypothetical protein